MRMFGVTRSRSRDRVTVGGSPLSPRSIRASTMLRWRPRKRAAEAAQNSLRGTSEAQGPPLQLTGKHSTARLRACADEERAPVEADFPIRPGKDGRAGEDR